jgi:Permuted papain-like amidase enzyme, YaeF/YiiX, C92 family
MVRKTAICLVFLLSSFCGAKSQINAYHGLREGDLLFQNLNCGPLCEAIEAVTVGVDNKPFSHCAMVVNNNGTLQVIEAIGTGVQLNSIYGFFARSGDTVDIKHTTIARLKDRYKGIIGLAVEFAKKQLGQPYDDQFVLNNGAWYCSELIYAAFKHANRNRPFFPLAPMTFKDPSNHQFFPAWTDYYKALQKPIPEGKPGTNPGLISRSNKITILK